MIKAKNGKVEGKGTEAELLADLAQIVCALIEEDTREDLIDVVVGLGKAIAKGKDKEYKAKVLKDTIIKKLEKLDIENPTTIGINLNELLKQIKKEEEENED